VNLADRAAEHHWFHRIDLGGGVVTDGVDDTAAKAAGVGLPADMTGLTVLDIGTFNGWFAFEAERRGAARVVATDAFIWERDPRSRAAFDFAREVLGSSVEPVHVAVEDLTPERVGQFDLVLFLGVLYHCQDPMRYLRICRSVCQETTIVETHVDALDYDRPAMVFYPGAALAGDETNHWGPNPAAVEAMLREVGYRCIQALPPWMPDRHTVHASV
jgi:tRNA (mo5U34)-methyltransferase